jgi:hypothetical protein
MHRRAAQLLVALAVSCAAGCKPASNLRLHYLPGFVPGSQQVFIPARIAVAPAGGELAQRRFHVGAIYGSDGILQRHLFVENLGPVVTAAVVRALADAGLKSEALTAAPAGDLPPLGIDYLLTTTIEDASVVKRFGAQHTVHGQLFTMKSSFKLEFVLSSRASPKLYQGEMIGTEEEPPLPVGGEVFLPLETEPAESLSVAMSRAIGALMLEARFRRILPLRAAAPSPSARATAIPSPTGTPTGRAHH